MKLAAWVLISQVNFALDILLTFAVLIEGHNDDAPLLIEVNLNVYPFVEGEEDALGVDFLVVVLCIDVHTERSRRIVPDCEALVELKHVVGFAAFMRLCTKRVLTKVLKPERGGITDFTSLVIEAGDI